MRCGGTTANSKPSCHSAKIAEIEIALAFFARAVFQLKAGGRAGHRLRGPWDRRGYRACRPGRRAARPRAVWASSPAIARSHHRPARHRPALLRSAMPMAFNPSVIAASAKFMGMRRPAQKRKIRRDGQFGIGSHSIVLHCPLWFTRRRGDAVGRSPFTIRCSPSFNVEPPKLIRSPTGKFNNRK